MMFEVNYLLVEERVNTTAQCVDANNNKLKKSFMLVKREKLSRSQRVRKTVRITSSV